MWQQKEKARMTRKEAHNIRTQIFVATELVTEMVDDYPESTSVQVAASKLEDVQELLDMFFSGLIFREDRRP